MSGPAPAIVTRGDAGNLHLPEETVNLVVTSPPYFGLRSYQDGGEHYADQIGAEATPAEYLDALMACTAEWMRVLKPGGSIFVNLGDKYAGSDGTKGGTGKSSLGGGRANGRPRDHGPTTFDGGGRRMPGRPKSLTGLPWRYAIRCIDELGLILRAEIVWAKPNGLPESVTDRVRRSHEQVFHFVKQPRYYSAVDEIREQYAPETAGKYAAGGLRSAIGNGAHPSKRNGAIAQDGDPDAWRGNPLGKLPGSVWTIPTSPLRVPEELGIDHFAAYPPELVRRIVLGWSPREVCTACGEGRRPVVTEGDLRPAGHPGRLYDAEDGRTLGAGRHGTNGSSLRQTRDRSIAGYTCPCDSDGYRTARGLPMPPTTPGVVLDPFGGTGTTALVASVHGRVGISVDLSADYCRLARWRTTDEKQWAKAAGMKPKAPQKAKPAPVADVIEMPAGQIELFGEGVA